MIYHISLRIKTPEGNWLTLGEDHKILWDIRDLIAASSGWTVLNQQSVEPADSVIPLLEKGILELTGSENAYDRYEALHGPGTIREALDFYRKLLQDCRDYPFTELYGSIAA